jgi:hypothetical protein
MFDKTIWMFELYNESKEVVYSLLIDEESGENTVVHCKQGWQKEFMIDSLFAYDSVEHAQSWSGRSMNSFWFVKDLKHNINDARKSLESFSYVLKSDSFASPDDSAFDLLVRAAKQYEQLKKWYPNIKLPFEPSEAVLLELEDYIQSEVERQKKEWSWSEFLNIPEPDRFYMESLTDLLGSFIENAQLGEYDKEIEVQSAIQDVAEEWGPLDRVSDLLAIYAESEKPNFHDEKEELIRCMSLDKNWWGSEEAIRDFVERTTWSKAHQITNLISNPRNWIDDVFRPPLEKFEMDFLEAFKPASEAVYMAVNHPKALETGIERYLEQHKAIPTEKIERYKKVLKSYPRVLKHFENSTHQQRYWIYRAFDGNGQLLYVGQTGEPLLRLRNHAGLSTFDIPGPKKVSAWFPLMEKLYLEPCLNKDEVNRKEAEYIRTEEPLFNKVHNVNSVNKTALISMEGDTSNVPDRNDPRNVGWAGLRHLDVQLPVSAFTLSEHEVRAGQVFFQNY